MKSGQPWIIQELCSLRNISGRYEDISVFVSEGVLQGIVSRISANEIVNVSNGGLFQPAVLLETQIEQPPK
jgi:hypothetical protein